MLQDQYYNMHEVLKDRMEILELAEAGHEGGGHCRPHPFSHPGRDRRTAS